MTRLRLTVLLVALLALFGGGAALAQAVGEDFWLHCTGVGPTRSCDEAAPPTTTETQTVTETVTEPGPTTTVTETVTVEAPPQAPTVEGGAIDAPADPGVWFGGTFHTEDIGADGNVGAWEQMVGKTVKIRQRFGGILESTGAVKPMLDVSSQCAAGQIPEVTMYPVKGGSSVESGVLARIINGQYDAGMRQQARDAIAEPCDLLVRLMPEMNGNWNKEWYAGGVLNGAEYVEAWKHVVQVWRDEGSAADVSFVWAPSIGSGRHTNYYPGDSWVDWIGGDAYSHGSCQQSTPNGNWQMPRELWGKSKFVTNPDPDFYDTFSVKGKPMIWSEGGSAETAYATDSNPATKAAWVRQLLPDFKAMPMLKAFTVEEYLDGNCNWQVDSSQATLDAYREVLADPYFVGR